MGAVVTLFHLCVFVSFFVVCGAATTSGSAAPLSRTGPAAIAPSIRPRTKYALSPSAFGSPWLCICGCGCVSVSVAV